jgi:hypothetical protein|tara:strand:- start:57 stop:389 length:333 start_codon:yes stop_codon:yes gene_type:complete
MESQIIDVDFDDGFKSIAKIVKDSYSEYEVALLEYYGDGEWDFDTEEPILITKDSVSGFYDTTDLERTGLYEKLKNGMYTEVDESDFEYELASSEDDESESDVSLDDEEL